MGVYKYVPADCNPATRSVAELLAQTLANAGFEVEARTSVVHTRVYIGVSNNEDDLHYVLQIDKN